MSTHENKAWAALMAKVEAAGKAYGAKYAKPQPVIEAHPDDVVHALIGFSLIVKGAKRRQLHHWKRIGEINADARKKGGAA